MLLELCKNNEVSQFQFSLKVKDLIIAFNSLFASIF